MCWQLIQPKQDSFWGSLGYKNLQCRLSFIAGNIEKHWQLSLSSMWWIDERYVTVILPLHLFFYKKKLQLKGVLLLFFWITYAF